MSAFMSIPITRDHPTLTLKDKVHEISKNFLTDFGFSYFQYLRCFADGSISLLTNNTGLFEHFQEVQNAPVVYSSFNEEDKNAHSYWFLWDEALPAYPVELARKRFHIHNGLTLVRRSKNYYDMIAVALPYEHANPGSFYLNKLKAIEQFIDNFDKDNKDLIGLVTKNPIALPEQYRDSNYKNICLTNGKVTVNGMNGVTYLTHQELASLRLLFQGASYKEIGQFLSISSRTVETYVQRVKLRTGFTSRDQLQRMLMLSFCQ
jgi:DNA-binding CsgD family transcriptional regulator